MKCIRWEKIGRFLEKKKMLEASSKGIQVEEYSLPFYPIKIFETNMNSALLQNCLGIARNVAAKHLK